MTTSTPKIKWIAALGISGVLLLGLVKLQYPFGADQAFFTIYAEKIATGSVLYKDLWSIKQPGIFHFYVSAGRIFGFDEFGVHLLELIYFILFCLLARHTLRDLFGSNDLYALFPLFTVGYYYLIGGSQHLTQIEILVSPIFYFMFFSVLRQLQNGPQRWLSFIFGVCLAVVIILKLVLVPIAFCFWAYFHIAVLKTSPRNWAVLAKANLFIFLGVLPLLVAQLAYLYVNDALAPFIWSTFEAPPRILNETSAGDIADKIGTLKSSLNWFFMNFSALICLAVLGMSSLFRRKAHHQAYLLLLWFCSALFVILIQKASWWEYHFLLLVFPLGISALAGLGFVFSQVKQYFGFNSLKTGMVLASAFIFVFYHPLHEFYRPAKSFVKHQFAMDRQSAVMFKKETSYYYGEVLSDVQFLKENAASIDHIVVFGDPRYLYLSGCRTSLSLNSGWYPIWLPEAWHRFTSEVVQKKPDYMFVCDHGRPYLENNSGAIKRLLDREYRIEKVNRTGTWYKRL